MEWRRVVLVTIVLAAVLVGCGQDGGSETAAPRWGDEAQAWMDGLVDSAERFGGIGMAPFFAEGTEIDARTISFSRRPFVGWDDTYLNYWRHVFYPDQDVWTEDFPYFIDVDGGVTVGTYVDPTPADGALVYTAMVLTLEVGPDGIRRQIPTFSTTALADIDFPAEVTVGAEAVAEAWVGAWTSGDPDEFGALYDTSVLIEDTIGRMVLAGVEDAVAHRRIEGEVAWSLAETSLGEPAVYSYTTDHGGLDGLLLVAIGDGGAGGVRCPGHQAVWLELDPDRGLVTAERRFRLPEDARRCVDPAALPDGWWTGRPLPGPANAPFEDLNRVTMEFTTGGRTVEIRNGTPTLASLVQWAVARYDRAGMAEPQFDSVTFSRYSDYCEDVQGRAIPVVADPDVVTWDLFVCFDEALVCADPSCTRFQLAPKRTMLHELAHVWVADNVGEAAREQFMADVGVDTWDDHSVRWTMRGNEWAAETIAWGLLDVPYSSAELGRSTDEQLGAGFRLLTGVQPIRPSG